MSLNEKALTDYIITLEARERMHTPEDWRRLQTKYQTRIARSVRDKIQSRYDKACAEGHHSLHTRSWLSGGMIHNKCTNCGKYWSRPDYPMTI